MDCTEFIERYSEYDDSLVSAAGRREFEAHLGSCQSCERYDRVLRKGRMLARQLPVPEPREDFLPDLKARLWASRVDAVDGRPAALLTGALTLVTILMATSTATWLIQRSDPAAGAVPIVRLADSVPATALPRAAVEEGSGAVTADAGSERRASARIESSGRELRRVAEAWTAGGVDRRRAASYSPLVIGPPAYRPGTAAWTSALTRRTLD